MDYRLDVVRIFVTDWERSLAFYSETLRMPIAFARADAGWAELDTGAARLALERIDPNDQETVGLAGRFMAVSLQVENVHAAYEELKSK